MAKWASIQSSLLGLKAANERPLTGTLGASLKGSGNLKNFAQSQFSAQIQTLQMKAGDQELHIQSPVHAEYRNRYPRVAGGGDCQRQIDTRIVRQSATRTQPAPSGALSLKGQIDLAQSTGFVLAPKGFTADGTMNVNLFLAGTHKNMTGSGTITMNDGTVTLPGIEVPLTDIDIRANVHGDSLILQQADAAWGQGRIALTGEFPSDCCRKKSRCSSLARKGPRAFLST